MTSGTSDRAPATLILEFPLVLRDPNQVDHHLQLDAHFWGDPDPESGDGAGVDLHLIYQSGPLADQLEEQTIVWGAHCQYPVKDFDAGYVDIGEGARYLPAPLMGRGLGTLMQSILVVWALQQPDAPLAELTLAGEDATSEEAIERRSRFWTNFGITFTDSRDGPPQVSLAMNSKQLKTPPMPSFRREGWRLTVPEALHEVFGQTHRSVAASAASS